MAYKYKNSFCDTLSPSLRDIGIRLLLEESDNRTFEFRGLI